MFPAGAAAMFPGQQPVFGPSSRALTAVFQQKLERRLTNAVIAGLDPAIH